MIACFAKDGDCGYSSIRRRTTPSNLQLNSYGLEPDLTREVPPIFTTIDKKKGVEEHAPGR